MEQKWEQLRQDIKPTKDELDRAIDNIGSATDILLEEIKAGYLSIKKTLI